MFLVKDHKVRGMDGRSPVKIKTGYSGLVGHLLETTEEKLFVIRMESTKPDKLFRTSIPQ